MKLCLPLIGVCLVTFSTISPTSFVTETSGSGLEIRFDLCYSMDEGYRFF